MKSESRKSITAITSCVHKKKSGVVVVRRTHLFLQFRSKHVAHFRGCNTHAMTIY